MNLPDGLMEEARSVAAATGRTTTSVVEEALRRFLDSTREPKPRRTLPVDGRPGGRFLIDLEDKDAVWAALDAPE